MKFANWDVRIIKRGFEKKLRSWVVEQVDTSFQNSILTKKSDPSDPSNFIKFDKIWYNLAEFQSDEVLYSKNPKNKKSTKFTD
jgi:hypothetical protein